ncbi:MAG: hypothetical protein H0U76_22085 [Ktedonobacteraceae bacterium]|nr:hypothetical protein [Ktedonobacteraceae bacterium]
MSRVGFSANTPTLLVLALISNDPQLRDAVVQEEHLRASRPDRRKDPEAVIRSYLSNVLYPLVQDSVYGPVYSRLIAYSVDQIEFQLVDWALRADNAVYFNKESAPIASKQAEVDLVLSNEETSVFWDAMMQNDQFASRIERLSREWKRNVRRGARILRAYFKLHSPMALRTGECPFIIQSLLGMILERINWIEVAALLLDVPYNSQRSLRSEEVEDHDPHVQLAILRETIWLGKNEFGDYVLDPWCSDALRGVCIDLADQCDQALQETRRLEEDGHIFSA